MLFRRLITLCGLLLAQFVAPVLAADPLVIAHRGASAYLPEHTLAAYTLAIWQGADFIEPDLVMTKDGHLIARHDNVLNLTTDVAQREEFASRKAVKLVDGIEVEGWFSEDFTLAEIRTLRAIERLPQLRTANTRFDGQFGIPTFEEVLKLIEGLEALVGRPLGVYPETKHPSHFDRAGLQMDEPLVDLLHRYGYRESGRAFIQSFEIANLKRISSKTTIPLVQLLISEGGPADELGKTDARSYQDMATPEGLAEIARYARGIGVYKPMILSFDKENSRWGKPTGLVEAAHFQGLLVHPYTFRAENVFLPEKLRSGDDPTGNGDLAAEIRLFIDAGVDGFFTDNPDLGRSIVDQMRLERQPVLAESR